MAIDAAAVEKSAIAERPVIEAVAPANSSSQSRLDAYLSIGTQYIYRGIALRDSGPAPTAEIAFNHGSGWFIDAWAGQIDVRDYYRYEIKREWQTDISAGYAAELAANWQWSFAHAWIINIDSPLPESENYQEWRANIFYRDNFSTQLAYTDDYRQLGFAVWNIEAKYNVAVANFAIAEIGIGRSHSAGDGYDNYNYGWIGVQKHWLHTDWKISWNYSGDGARAVLDKNRAGSRVALTVSWVVF